MRLGEELIAMLRPAGGVLDLRSALGGRPAQPRTPTMLSLFPQVPALERAADDGKTRCGGSSSPASPRSNSSLFVACRTGAAGARRRRSRPRRRSPRPHRRAASDHAPTLPPPLPPTSLPPPAHPGRPGGLPPCARNCQRGCVVCCPNPGPRALALAMDVEVPFRDWQQQIHDRAFVCGSRVMVRLKRGVPPRRCRITLVRTCGRRRRGSATSDTRS